MQNETIRSYKIGYFKSDLRILKIYIFFYSLLVTGDMTASMENLEKNMI